MSCAALTAASVLWFAVLPAQAAPAPAPALMAASAVSPLASEPLFADIIGRAGALRAELAGWKGREVSPAELAAFEGRARELAALDMKGHFLLAERGTDGDLKCILKGIAEDIPLKLDAVAGARDARARDAAITDLDYLLRDNVEVIEAPPAPPA
jgi:hypothetical protein